MAREFNKANLKDIFRMLTEIAKGNFAYKIQRTNNNDDIEAISVQLNMMAEELRENLNHLSYVNPHVTYEHLTHTSIVVDADYKILACTQNLFRLLELPKKKILEKNFSVLLSPSSFEYWRKIQEQIDTEDFNTGTFQLEFSSSSNLLVPARCSISKLCFSRDKSSAFIFTFFSTVLHKNENPQAQSVVGNREKQMSKWDVKALQEVHDYVSGNFEIPPLPNIELAHKFGINEHKLNRGFRLLFGTTPFKLYNILRLEEAKTLIKNTNNSLEDIAFKLGFKSYPHFSKSFKGRFGYSPREFKKMINSEI